MKQFVVGLIGSSVVLLIAGYLSAGLTTSSAAIEAPVTSKPPVEKSLYLKQIQSYREWTRVNLVSLPLDPSVAGLCRAPTRNELIATEQNPHRERGKFFAIYVNEIGRKAMLTQKKPEFPRDSIIVKQKLPSEKSTTPELLTVMIKRERGFNWGYGDWEFLVLDGKATEIQARGNLMHCQTCHLLYSDTDYVFRTYLPNQVKQSLR